MRIVAWRACLQIAAIQDACQAADRDSAGPDSVASAYFLDVTLAGACRIETRELYGVRIARERLPGLVRAQQFAPPEQPAVGREHLERVGVIASALVDASHGDVEIEHAGCAVAHP